MTTYAEVGATCVGEDTWSRRPAGFRWFERTVRIGHGDDDWQRARSTVLRWGVKTRSGFAVHPALGGDLEASAGRDYTLIASVGPFRVREPARVVSVVDRPERCGFAYGTLAGHPVTGEEAFVVHRRPDGSVWFTLRSLTRPGLGRWRLAFPAILVAQRWYRRRYVRAIRDALTGPS